MSLDAEDDETIQRIARFVGYQNKTERFIKAFEIGLFPIYQKYGFTLPQAMQIYCSEQSNQWLSDITENTKDEEDWK